MSWYVFSVYYHLGAGPFFQLCASLVLSFRLRDVPQRVGNGDRSCSLSVLPDGCVLKQKSSVKVSPRTCLSDSRDA